MKTGFTLVEMMLSIALMAVLAVGINTFFISSLRSARKAATNSIVKSEGEQIQTNVVQTVKFAKRISENCTNVSLRLLSSNGSDISYSVLGGNLVQVIDPPDPTPIVTMPLNSAKTVVSGCGGIAFTCTEGGNTVDMCLVLSSAGAADVTEATSMTFRNYIFVGN